MHAQEGLSKPFWRLFSLFQYLVLERVLKPRSRGLAGSCTRFNYFDACVPTQPVCLCPLEVCTDSVPDSVPGFFVDIPTVSAGIGSVSTDFLI